MIVSESASTSLEKLQVSIVVPVYNQERNVSTALSRIKRVLDSTGLTYEIVVVNDGSKDGTLDVLRREEKAGGRVRVITYSRNMGKGYAVKTGIVQSQGALIMFTDGDLNISPHIISEYLRQLEGCDLVIASKRHPQSKIHAPLSRKFLSRAFNVVVRILTGISIRDTQAGLKAGNGPALRAIFKLMLVKRYAFDVELLTIASVLKMQIKEMPVEIKLDRGFKAKEIARMFVDLLGISYRLRFTRWYQKQVTSQTVSIKTSI